MTAAIICLAWLLLGLLATHLFGAIVDRNDPPE